MRFCFMFLAFGLCSAWAAPAASLARSVVRVDARTGRLVRSVVVNPRVIAPQPGGAALYRPAATAGESDVLDIVEETAKQHDLDPLLVQSVISVESNYNTHAVSHKGAQGLMQLIPATARRFGVSNVFNARDNITGGVKYLKYLTTLFPNDLRLALAAYNAGEGAVIRYGHNIPPYRETENYVYKVGKRYGNARREADRKKSEPLTAKAAAGTPAGPQYRSVEHFVDANGRLHLRTVEPRGAAAHP